LLPVLRPDLLEQAVEVADATLGVSSSKSRRLPAAHRVWSRCLTGQQAVVSHP